MIIDLPKHSTALGLLEYITYLQALRKALLLGVPELISSWSSESHWRLSSEKPSFGPRGTPQLLVGARTVNLEYDGPSIFFFSCMLYV